MRWLSVALVGLCVACGSGAAGPAGGGSSPAPAAQTPRGPVAKVSVGAGPVGLTVDAAGALWVASASASQVSRVRSGAQDLSVDGLDVPLRLVATESGVWATAFGSGDLVRIAANGAVQSRVPVGKGAEGVASGFGALWVVAQDAGRLVRVDPARSRVVARIDIGVGARLVTTGLGAVWVTHFQDGRLLRVDPKTGAVTRSGQLCQGPQGLVTAADAVWVTCTKDNRLLRIDPKALTATATLPMPEAPDGIAAGPDDLIYVVAQAGPTLVTVDPTSGAVRARTSLGGQAQLFDQANLDVAVGPDGVWVSSFSEDVVRRLPLG